MSHLASTVNVLCGHAQDLGVTLTALQIADAVCRADGVNMLALHTDDQRIVARGIVATVAA